MKRLRVALAALMVFVLALAVLVWFLPAAWALRLMQPQLHGLRFEQVSGTLWQGYAGQVSSGNATPLGSLAWMLSRRALIGDVQLGFDLRQPRLRLQGQVHRVSATQQDWRDVTLNMDMSLLGMQPWLHGQPQGELSAHVPRAQLQGNWPMQLDATGIWPSAAVRTAQEMVPLGTLLLKISGDEGVIQAALDDDGHGPLQTSGRLSFSPLGWDLRVSLKPRGHEPSVLRWLHTLGPVAADGVVQLRYRGGLAQFNPSAGKP